VSYNSVISQKLTNLKVFVRIQEPPVTLKQKIGFMIARKILKKIQTQKANLNLILRKSRKIVFIEQKI